MESSLFSSLSYSYSKMVLGIGFALFAGVYTYYHFIYSNPNANPNVYSPYIGDYLKEIAALISKANGSITESILCHINFIKHEIMDNIRKNKDNKKIDERRRAALADNDEYNKLLIESDKINESYQEEAINCIQAFLLNECNISNYVINRVLLANDNVINLPSNKHFSKLMPYPEFDLPKGLNNEKIDDAFFFASVNQIDYDKILNQYFDLTESQFQIEMINQLKSFKQKFKDQFYERYGYESKYLSDLIVNKEGINAQKLIVLINKVTF